MIHKKQLYAKIGENIRRFRQKLGLKQENLCKMVDLNRSSIAQIEAGKQAVTIYTLYRLSEAFQIRIVDILPDELVFDRYSMDRVKQKDDVLYFIDKVKEVHNV